LFYFIRGSSNISSSFTAVDVGVAVTFFLVFSFFVFALGVASPNISSVIIIKERKYINLLQLETLYTCLTWQKWLSGKSVVQQLVR